MPEEKLEILS